MVAAEIGRWVDVFSFNQFGEFLGSAFKCESRIVETGDCEQFPANFETKGVVPLQLLRRVRKAETAGANRVDIHVLLSESESRGSQSKLKKGMECNFARLEIQT